MATKTETPIQPLMVPTLSPLWPFRNSGVKAVEFRAPRAFCYQRLHGKGRRATTCKMQNEISTNTLMPAFNTAGRVGHLLRTAKGFRACDANDKEIGVSETPAAGIAALLERATDTA